MGRLNSVTFGGRTFTREQLREELPRLIDAARNDPKHPYRDTRHPDHAAAVSEVNLAYRWLHGEVSETDEAHIATELKEAFEPDMNDTMTPAQELAELMKQPGTQTALQKSRTASHTLTPAEKRIVERHNELEAANNAIADSERRVFSSKPSRGLYIPSDALPWATNKNRTLRVHGAAEHITKVGADRNHDYWNAASAGHKAAVLGMKIAHDIVENGEAGVSIGADGLVEVEGIATSQYGYKENEQWK
jgi:hypothetical protein